MVKSVIGPKSSLFLIPIPFSMQLCNSTHSTKGSVCFLPFVLFFGHWEFGRGGVQELGMSLCNKAVSCPSAITMGRTCKGWSSGVRRMNAVEHSQLANLQTVTLIELPNPAQLRSADLQTHAQAHRPRLAKLSQMPEMNQSLLCLPR